ncbi:sel1 repeat family protein [Lujinxingia sediminis]|uniref:Sel1 repeat family protein n=1 Tax=Lujinxingia sediminis TaxID=2480984 RepID=A0ABY0CWH8_9DELT|nr:tetratricopeptide repeat protein [Lujinxingia sediminis]RVU47916.1 sel1 repeat family protein [Lujinxingia sediminis]
MQAKSKGNRSKTLPIVVVLIVALGAWVFFTGKDTALPEEESPSVAHHSSVDSPSGESPASPAPAYATLDDPRAALCEDGDAQACHSLANDLAFDTERAKELPLAIELFTRACQLERGEACHDLGLIHSQGVSVPQDPDQARHFFERACELGQEQGCADARNVGTGTSLADYAPQWEESCEQGDPKACMDLAVALLLNEEGSDPARAEELLNRACQLDDAEGCLRLAELHETLGRPVAEVQARIQDACAADYGPACTTLADRLKDAAAEPARVDALYARACEIGDVNGCSEHALRLAQSGELSAARTLWKEGCERWHGYSCFHHARSFLEAASGQETSPQMIFGFERACALNVPVACYNLAIYFNTRQPDPDFTRGRELLSRGCELGHLQACTFAAQMRSAGQGGPVDSAGARNALERACELGDARACTRAQP